MPSPAPVIAAVCLVVLAMRAPDKLQNFDVETDDSRALFRGH